MASADGFIIAEINGLFNQLLRETDYNILSQCKNFEDLVIKLNQHFPFINEDMPFTVYDLRFRLYSNIRDELCEFESRSGQYLQYFTEYNQIVSFFIMLETGKEALVPGATEELKGLSKCKTLNEAIKLYVQGTPLEKYFHGIKGEEGDYQKVQALVMKRHLDHYYEKAVSGYFREILEAEGDRQLLEICFNAAAGHHRAALFPMAGTLSGKIRSELAKCECAESARDVLSSETSDPIAEAIKHTIQVYADAFRQYDDPACVYAYFRLKEQEMNNILWISECILQDCGDLAKEVITFE